MIPIGCLDLFRLSEVIAFPDQRRRRGSSYPVGVVPPPPPLSSTLAALGQDGYLFRDGLHVLHVKLEVLSAKWHMHTKYLGMRPSGNSCETVFLFVFLFYGFRDSIVLISPVFSSLIPGTL